MKCLYCDKEINTYTLYDLFIEQDVLCNECRKKMKYHHQKFHLDDLEVESFYDYDSLFKELLLQYKECYDEALKDVFLYRLEDYLRIKYFGYQIIYVPSCKENSERRGFNHLKEIFEKLNFQVAEIKNNNGIFEVSVELIVILSEIDELWVMLLLCASWLEFEKMKLLNSKSIARIIAIV